MHNSPVVSMFLAPGAVLSWRRYARNACQECMFTVCGAISGSVHRAVRFTDDMLAALAYWLTGAGVPCTFHVAAAHATRSNGVTGAMQGPAAGLVQCMRDLTGLNIQQQHFAGLSIKREYQHEPAVKDSLMYN